MSVVTDLGITGRVAQFGRGALANVGKRLLGQLVTSLEKAVLGDGGAGAGTRTEGVARTAQSTGTSSAEGEGGAIVGVTQVGPGVASQDSTTRPGLAPGVPGQAREVVPVELVRVAPPVIVERALPVLAVVALLVLRRRRQRPAG